MDGERGRHTAGLDPVPITNTLELPWGLGQPHFFAVCWEGDFFVPGLWHWNFSLHPREWERGDFA